MLISERSGIACRPAGRGALAPRVARALALICAMGAAPAPEDPAGAPETGGAAAEAPPAAAKAAGAEGARSVADRLPMIAGLVGEELLYRGRIFKGVIGMDVGEAIFRVARGEAPNTVALVATAEGGKLGYTLKARVSTVLGLPACRPVLSTYDQEGSEWRRKKLLFRPGEIFYLKMKHCRDPRCGNPAHLVWKTHWAGGIVPWGRERVHCADCDDPAHFVWTQRDRFAVKEPFLDALACLYAARAARFEPEGPAVLFPLVQDHDLWKVSVRAIRRERIEVDAGAFSCLLVSLEPRPASEGAELREEFKGLFGIHGSIRVWIDERTRIPVLIRGSIPFAFMTLHAEVILKEIRRRAQGLSPAAAKTEASR